MIAYFLLRISFIPNWLERRLIAFVRARNRITDRNLSVDCNTVWVDVSVIFKSDARTGIQRVVKAISTHLGIAARGNYTVRFIAASKTTEYFEVNWSNQRLTEVGLWDISKQTKPGDIFLGLDLAAHILPTKYKLLTSLKKNGVLFYFFIYDLLPLRNPLWFSRKLVKAFRCWIRVVAGYSDGVFCISETVCADFASYLNDELRLSSIPGAVVPLGGDFQNSFPSYGLPDYFNDLKIRLSRAKWISLMVGTLEPRKGHRELLAAYEHIWSQDNDHVLILIGKPGWKTADLQNDLHTHPELGKRLYWFQDVTDEFLSKLYSICDGVVVPSHSEGFGLPVMEAIACVKPVLVRDIPVFREFSNPLITYFSPGKPEYLAHQICAWTENCQNIDLRDYEGSIVKWADTAKSVINAFVSRRTKI